jgi:pyridoxamine 5'-phosphate oxidase
MKKRLLESNIPEDPINLFNTWFHEAEEFGGNEEVNAMTVATVGLDGFPKSRVVLLKNLLRKDLFSILIIIQTRVRLLPTTPKYVFLFLALYGTTGYNKRYCPKTTESSSDNYFDSRPEGSKLGAVVSNQSEVVFLAYLEENLQQLEKTLVAWLFQDPNIGLLSCT